MNLSNLGYSTYFGSFNSSRGIAADPSGNVYVVGLVDSILFPTTPGSFDTTYNGGRDAFVARFNLDGSLAYSTFLGGNGYDEGLGIAVDSSGAAYITGETEGFGFPTTAGAYDTSYNGSRDAYITKLNPTGSALVYSTFIGGTSSERGNSIALDSFGAAYITGTTSSSDFPVTAGAYDVSLGGFVDAFVVKLNPAGSARSYASFLGGTNSDYGAGISVDGAGSAYVVGSTGSNNFPITPGVVDNTYAGPSEAFVTKFNPSGATIGYSTYLGGANEDIAKSVAVNSSGNVYIGGITLSPDFPWADGFQITYGGAQRTGS